MDKTLRELERVLLWEPFSADAVLEGGDPVELPAAEVQGKPPASPVVEVLTTAGELLSGIEFLAPDEQRQVSELVELGRRRREQAAAAAPPDNA